jgi:molybdenum cofactor cytidylyltransferase
MPSDLSITPDFPTAIILAAGASSRMGTPKGLLRLNSSTLIQQHIRALRPFSRKIIVVTGAHQHAYQAVLPLDVEQCHNSNWATTDQATSLCLALSSQTKLSSIWLVPVDTAPAQRQTLQQLLALRSSCVPIDNQGRPGHPALLGQEILTQLNNTPLPQGIRPLLQFIPKVEVTDPTVSWNFNTPDDWKPYIKHREGLSTG